MSTKKEVTMTPNEQYQCLELLRELYNLTQLTTHTRAGYIVNGIDHNVALAKLEVCEDKVYRFLHGR